MKTPSLFQLATSKRVPWTSHLLMLGSGAAACAALVRGDFLAAVFFACSAGFAAGALVAGVTGWIYRLAYARARRLTYSVLRANNQNVRVLGELTAISSARLMEVAELREQIQVLRGALDQARLEVLDGELRAGLDAVLALPDVVPAQRRVP